MKVRSYQAFALICAARFAHVLAFLTEFKDHTTHGSGFISRPQHNRIGNPLSAGSAIETALDVRVAKRQNLGETLVPVQFIVWEETELREFEHRNAITSQAPLWSSSSEAMPLTDLACCEGSCVQSNDTTTDLLNIPNASIASGRCLCSAPLHRTKTIWLTPNVTRGVRLNVTIEESGVFYVSVSMCGEPEEAGTTAAPLRLQINGAISWVRIGGFLSRTSRGSLPGGFLGIVPFYGTLSALYLILSLAWSYRMLKFWGYTITLQLTLFMVMVANLLFCVLAFGYYLHLDLDTKATARQIFGGMYAGLYEFRDPFAIIIASYRFILMSSSQALLTMLCDGLFVLRPLWKMRQCTKAFILLLIVGQFLLLVLQHEFWRVGPWLHPLLQICVTGVWMLWLGCTSWSTWHSLYAEEPDDLVRWSTPLKQRVYKTVCRAVFLYPLLTTLVYAVFFVFMKSWQWIWLRLVVFDFWMLMVITPASYHWIPHSTSAQYAPLMEEMPAAAKVMEMTKKGSVCVSPHRTHRLNGDEGDFEMEEDSDEFVDDQSDEVDELIV